VHLIINSYLENFQPDTTPVLPDLLHPSRNAQGLGGFLQGKALLTDDAGGVLYIGAFLAEAFLDNSNHTVIRLEGSGTASGGVGTLKGMFRLSKNGALQGHLDGRITLPAAARKQIADMRGKTMRPLKQIINVVDVKPAPMMGKAKTGTPNAPLRTGFGHPTKPQTSTGSERRSVPIWAVIAAGGAVVAFLLSGILFWMGRTKGPPQAVS
jgi:hypothetical protein